MRNYYCTLCGYRYISAFQREEREEDTGRMPHQPNGGRGLEMSSDSPDFELLSAAWRCPHCGALKRFFRPEPGRF